MVVVAISTQGQSFRWVNAIPSAVAVLGILAAAFWGSRLAAKKTLEGEREVATTYAFEASGFGISSAGSSTRAEWSTLHHWEEGPSAFLLYVNEHLPYVVPKRAFQDADLPRVRALIVAHVGKRGEQRARKGVLTARQRTIIKWIVLMVAFFLLRAFVRNRWWVRGGAACRSPTRGQRGDTRV